MADQLSLFPSEEFPAAESADLPSDVNALDELFAVARAYRNSRTYKRLLVFISRFPQYSAFNGFLMYLQNPRATGVATAGAWSRRFGRNPAADARPMMILAPMAPVRFLFDVADTEGGPLDPDAFTPVGVRGRALQEIYDKTVENCSVHGIAVRSGEPSDPRAGQVVTLTYDTKRQYRDFQPGAQSNYLIVLDKKLPLEDRYDALVHGLGHIFCGHLGIDRKAWWADRRGLDQPRADIEAESIGFLVLRRKSLTEPSKKYLAGYAASEQVLPPFSLTAVFQSTQYIEDMGKALWQFPRRKSRYL